MEKLKSANSSFRRNYEDVEVQRAWSPGGISSALDNQKAKNRRNLAISLDPNPTYTDTLFGLWAELHKFKFDPKLNLILTQAWFSQPQSEFYKQAFD